MKPNVRNLMVFAIGATAAIDVDLVGRVTISELLIVFALPFLISTTRIWSKRVLLFFKLFVIAFIGMAISDLFVNHVTNDYFLKGTARYAFMLAICVFWYCVTIADRNILLWYMWGLVPGGIIRFFRVSEFDRETIVNSSQGYDFWAVKGTPLILIGVCLTALYCFRKSRFMAAAVITSGGILNALIASRSKSAAILFGAFVVARSKKGATTNLVRPALVSLVGIALLYFGYIISAPKGYLGEYQRLKFENQSQTIFGVSPLGLLMGGRTDFLESLLAVRDAPVWGTGSWSIPRVYLFEAHDLVGDPYSKEVLSLRVAKTAESSGHSVIFGSWATGGILVLPFWGYTLYLCSSLLLFTISRVDKFTPFLAINGAMILFALFFNPFSLTSRNSIGLYSGIACALLAGARKGQPTATPLTA